MNVYLLVWILTLGLLCSCKASYKHVNDAAVYYQPGRDSFTASDSTFLEFILPYREKLDSSMNQVLVMSSGSLEKGLPESSLGNMVADACMEISKDLSLALGFATPDFCVLNNGGLRSSLPAGVITLKNVYELMPFENELVIVSLKGPEVMNLFEYILEKGGVPVSNLRMTLVRDHLYKTVVGNSEFDSAITYRVLTSDYLAYGGDAMTVFGKNIKIEKTQKKVRDAIIEYLMLIQKNNGILHPVTDGRITK